MPSLDLSGFDTKPESFEGLDQIANTIRQRNILDRRFAMEQEGKRAATSKFLTDYLDPKDHLTGTAYDPQIVNGLQSLLETGEQLAGKGADTNAILMALGPQVAKLNQYSTTAKQINDQIKNSIQRLKPYAGYNPEAMETEAKKEAFYGPDGQLKDISQVDPNTDWVSQAAKNHPELITTAKGLDDFVAKTPMADYTKSVSPMYQGKSRTQKVQVQHPFWMDMPKDANGNYVADSQGNAQRPQVVTQPIIGDDGKPMIDPETNQPYQALDKSYFNAIMAHNPDIADYIRGEVNRHFQAAGAKQLPAEGSPQWSVMARSVLAEELAARDKSHFNILDQQKESAQAIKIDIAQNPADLQKVAEFNAAQRGTGDYAAYNPKNGKAMKTNAVEAVGHIFNNDPDYLQGEQENVNGRNVIDVTQYFPGGGLKTGRGSDEVYKQIYYDPAKRSLLATTEPRVKDAQGNKPMSLEEIPESKAGFFMSRIAASNGVDPGKVSSIMSQLGYNHAKFQNPADYGQVGARMNQEQSDKIDGALKNNSWDALKGVSTKDGEITQVEERSGTSWIPGRDRYAVYVKGADGKPVKAFTTSDKAELEKYVKSGNATPTKKAILD